MQIRFREFKNDGYSLLGYIDVADYDVAFKMLTFMKEHECEYALELNTIGIVEREPESNYYIKNVSLCIPSIGNDLMPHITVDCEECY